MPPLSKMPRGTKYVRIPSGRKGSRAATGTCVWVRLGDAGEYDRHDSVEGAALSIREAIGNFGHEIRDAISRVRMGLECPGFRGNNYISLFIGDDESQPKRELTGDEFALVKGIILEGV